MEETPPKVFVRVARVVKPTMPVTAEEEFGTLVDWSMAQQEDPMLGSLCDWVRMGMRPTKSDVAQYRARVKAYWA